MQHIKYSQWIQQAVTAWKEKKKRSHGAGQRGEGKQERAVIILFFVLIATCPCDMNDKWTTSSTIIQYSTLKANY